MRLYSEGKSYKLYQGDMTDMLEVLQPNSVDSVVTDPPYELNFMGKGWDNSGIAFQKSTWEQCLKVLKPGGYLLAFGGTRTFHRIACAIEDAGFEIRDTIMWLYGSGFPKSMNIGLAIDRRNGAEMVLGDIKQGHDEFANRKTDGDTKFKGAMEGFDRPWMHDTDKMQAYHYEKVLQTEEAKQWDGWGTALKPAYEPIIVARKPCEGSCTDNVLAYGVGGINIDECRIPTDDYLYNHGNSNGTVDSFSVGNFGKAIKGENRSTDLGRFPSNVILTYDETDEQEVCGGMPQTESNGGVTTMPKMGGGGLGVCNYQTIGADRVATDYIAPNDSGSVARYFYCAKASKKDRDDGCDMLDDGLFRRMRPDKDDNNPTGLNTESRFAPVIRKNVHPTVKPTTLMQYLVRLVTPKGGTVLDPFNGSGSTGKAVMYENYERQKDYQYIGIELTEQYLPIAQARIEYAQTGVLCGLADSVAKVVKKKSYKTGGLF